MVGENICPKMYLRGERSDSASESSLHHHSLGGLAGSQSSILSIGRAKDSKHDDEEGHHESSDEEGNDLSSTGSAVKGEQR